MSDRLAIFSPEQLQKVLAETLPATGKQHALVATVDQDGARVVASFTLKDRWQLQGAFTHDWNGEDAVGGKVVYS